MKENMQFEKVNSHMTICVGFEMGDQLEEIFSNTWAYHFFVYNFNRLR